VRRRLQLLETPQPAAALQGHRQRLLLLLMPHHFWEEALRPLPGPARGRGGGACFNAREALCPSDAKPAKKDKTAFKVPAAANIKSESSRQSLLEAVRSAMRIDNNNLQHFPTHVRADREIMMAAVTTDGHALCRASIKLQGDREVVLRALKIEGRIMKFASIDLRLALNGAFARSPLYLHRHRGNQTEG